MDGIAIIGMGCRLPGGVETPRDFWRLLSEGRSAICEIPAARWDLEGFYDPEPDKASRSVSKWGGFLDDVAAFDAAFFGFSGTEARSLDPQQRLLLMVAFEATQNAGLTLAALKARDTGVFVGVSNADYGRMQRTRSNRGEPRAGTGTVLSIAANRISNAFDLSGPSVAVDTACSSALVALDAACRHLTTGSCDLAFAGGANIILDPHLHRTFSRAHMLSPTGEIRAFDARADGFVRGEGVGLVLLKREEDAVRDGDTMLGVIRATAVNQDGATGTITAPSESAQKRMLAQLLADAKCEADNIAFVEAHGTGTPLGDPIEAQAIGEILAGPKRDAPLLVGSTKTNLGHLEPAAGIAGLIKAVLALNARALPASLGFEHPNPDIEFDTLKIDVPTGLTPLPDDKPLAVVNSFGFGGTNAGAMIERGPVVPPRASVRDEEATAVPVPISARSMEQLRAYAGALAQAMRVLDDTCLKSIAAALAARDHFPHRAVIVAHSIAELRQGLDAIAAGREASVDTPEIVAGVAGTPGKLAFTTSGQGGQWWAMGRALLKRHATFRETIENFDALFEPEAGWSVIDVLTASETDERIHDAAITPAVMFAFQSGLAAVWQAIGIKPDILVGHSFGEVTAAALAGAIDQTDVPRLARHRGLIRGAVDRVGTMAAIGLDARQIEAFLPGDGSVEIGAYNAPGMVTVTGDRAAIDGMIARIEAVDPAVRTHRLALDFAYHSSWFDPAEETFKAALGTIECRSPSTPIVSSVTGALETHFDTDYWWSNLRQPVLYQKAIECALDLGAETFVELGPKRTLSSLTAGVAAAQGHDALTVSTIDGEKDDFAALGSAIAKLYVHGHAIDWSALLGQAPRGFALPPLPWQLQDYWHESEEVRAGLSPETWHPLLGTRDQSAEPTWSAVVSLEDLGFLSDHRLDGKVLFPAAAMIEMIRAAGQSLFKNDSLEITDLHFPQALELHPGTDVAFETRYATNRRWITIHSRITGEADWTLRASAKILARTAVPPTAREPVHGRATDTDSFYDEAASRGYHYGPAFQKLSQIVAGAGTASGRVTLAGKSDALDKAVQCDPRLLDACLQLLIAASEKSLRYLPDRIDRIRLAGNLRNAASANLALRRSPAGELCADLEIRGEQGDGSISIDGLHATSFGRPDARSAKYYEETLIALPDLDADRHGKARRTVVLGATPDSGSTDLALTLARAGRPTQHLICGADEAADECRLRERLTASAAGDVIDELVYAVPLDQQTEASLDDLPAAISRTTHGVLAFGQALAALDAHHRPGRIWIVTRGVRGASNPRGLAQGTLTGFARSLALECSDLTFVLADIDDASSDCLASLIGSDVDESELVIRDNKARVPRLEPKPTDAWPDRTVHPSELKAGRGFSLAKRKSGGIASLFWQENTVPPCPAGQVQVDVKWTGLNFRDVMAVTGVLPSNAEPQEASDRLGLEFSGTVAAIGLGETRFKVGDPVFGIAPGALAKTLTLPAETLFPIPDGSTMAEAAAMPVAYMTAHYALRTVGRLAKGERVLIHNATGGVGLAAINIARVIGAEIFATAGSPEKRAALSSLGIAHVADSRSLDFADDFRAASSGQGMDLVLNALAGPYIDAGLDLLAPHGRFIELGKRDIYEDGALGLSRLKRNRAFYAVDILALLEDRPAEIARLMDEVLADIRSGHIKSLPVTRFGGADVQGAFAAFAEAQHQGKIVVDLDDPTISVHTRKPQLDSDGTYLVTGGTRGFGLAAARWLELQGARHIVLASRTGQTAEPVAPPYQVQQLDVSDAATVRAWIAEIEASPNPLRGIIHAAVSYEDAPLAEISGNQLDRVLAPKAIGALNLTRSVIDVGAELDFFLSLSSLAQVIGWPGQASYAAANGFLEALTGFQNVHGVPGQCLNLGALGQSGFVGQNQAMQDYLTHAGWGAMTDDTALEGLARALTSSAPIMTFADADWTKLLQGNAALARAARLQGFGTASSGRTDRLIDLDGQALADASSALAIKEIAALAGTSPSEVGKFETLDDVGIDSLSIFELRNRIESATGLALPVGRFMACTQIDDVGSLIAALVNERRRDTDVTTANAAE